MEFFSNNGALRIIIRNWKLIPPRNSMTPENLQYNYRQPALRSTVPTAFSRGAPSRVAVLSQRQSNPAVRSSSFMSYHELDYSYRTKSNASDNPLRSRELEESWLIAGDRLLFRRAKPGSHESAQWDCQLPSRGSLCPRAQHVCSWHYQMLAKKKSSYFKRKGDFTSL